MYGKNVNKTRKEQQMKKPKFGNMHMNKTLLSATILALSVSIGRPAQAQAEKTPATTTEWPSYGGDKASSKYSPLDQINADNFKSLKTAWTWRSVDEAVTKANPNLLTWTWEATPLVIGGVMYVSTSMSQAAALDAATGAVKWTYDPETWKNGTPSNNGFVHRGVAYWSDGSNERIFLGTGDGFLIALDAKTGKIIPTFGQDGRIDLTEGLGRPVERKLYGVSSPPIICRDVVAIGSKVEEDRLKPGMPPGDVRGFDVRTGKQRWQFHAIPQKGEFGNETWERNSWKTIGAANVWTLMSADDELGYVYLPFGTSANDHYGVERPGNGLFGDSLVCVDVQTGKRVWHFQMAHHGLWDYDLPAAPNLLDINVNGKLIKAIAQVSKQGFVYVFDRVTGKPVWDIEERPVPQSKVTGEKSSATQPFPTKPAPFDRQGVTENDLIDFTPELRKGALAILEKYTYGPLYTPPSLDKPTIMMPGIAGGASWSGGAVDPETGIFYISSITFPYVMELNKSKTPGIEYSATRIAMETMQDIPLWKPPYGRVTAIDMNTGTNRWMSPVGDLAQDLAKQGNPLLKDLGLSGLGRPARGHLLLTKTLLIVGQEGTTQRESAGTTVKAEIRDPKLVAYDKTTGKVVGEVPLPRNATAAPMTYLLNGKQYIAVATGGANLSAELIVLSLP
jgi:quinoprotein glucose dehydrogenase